MKVKQTISAGLAAGLVLFTVRLILKGYDGYLDPISVHILGIHEHSPDALSKIFLADLVTGLLLSLIYAFCEIGLAMRGVRNGLFFGFLLGLFAHGPLGLFWLLSGIFPKDFLFTWIVIGTLGPIATGGIVAEVHLGKYGYVAHWFRRASDISGRRQD